MSQTSLRCFIAVEFSSPLRQYLGELAHKLAKTIPERTVSWVKSDSIHLTLKFLGDTSEDQIAKLADPLTRAISPLASFSITTTQLGCFPNLRQPRVIWVGLDPDSASRLIKLQTAVESATVPQGFPAEARPFSPHITLGRVRHEASSSLTARVGEVVKSTGKIEQATDAIQGVVLMKSDLRPGGPVYTVLHKASLQA